MSQRTISAFGIHLLATVLLLPGMALAQAVHKAETASGAMAEQMAAGETLYGTHCGACHQPNGQGLKGAFPPLAGSDYLKKNRKRAIGVILEGLSGEIKVNDVKYNGVMPAMGYLSDDEVAAILTYTTNSWGNEMAAFSAEEVAKRREATGTVDRAEGVPWYRISPSVAPG